MIEPAESPIIYSPISSLDEAEAAGGLVAGFDLLIKEVLARKNRLEMAAQRRGKKIQEFQRKRDAHALRLKAWCEAKPELMQGTKSLELRHVTLSFRDGRAGLALLKDWTDSLVLKAMGRKKIWADCIRIKREVDRQTILKYLRPEVGKLKQGHLAKVGLVIAKETFFYCDSKQSQ